MVSEVNPSFPADNVKVSKSDFRAEMLKIYNEITALQARTSVAGLLAFHDVPSKDYIDRMFALSRASFAKDHAFNRVSMTTQ